MNEGGQWQLDKCNCGSRNCRGRAQDFLRLSVSLQREMVSKGLVMSHIHKDLDESLKPFIPPSKVFVGQNTLGNAVYAQDFIKKGELILKFSGPLMKESEIPIEVADRHYYMEISQDKWLGPSSKVDDFVNHSCEPNSAGKAKPGFAGETIPARS